MGLLNGAEAYHIDPRFNQGVSVTLAPSVTAIKRIFEKKVYKFYKGGYPSPPLRMESYAPFEPLVKITELLQLISKPCRQASLYDFLENRAVNWGV
jgi:hypothetical protein